VEPKLDSTGSWRPSLRIVAVYVVFLTAWILGSDAVVAAVATDAEEVTRLQTLKGFFFIAISAALLYELIRRVIGSIQVAYQDVANREATLALVLDQLPVNIWTTDPDLTVTSVRGRGIPGFQLDETDLVGKRIGESEGRSGDPEFAPVQAHLQSLSGKDSRFTVVHEDITMDAFVTPMRDAEDEVIGCLGFALDVSERVHSDVELSRTVERLKRLNEQREILLRHLVKAEEAERKRIAAGIHDDSIQVMTSAAMALDLLVGRLTAPDHLELADRARSMVRDAIGRLRNLVFHLRPIALEEAGLAAATRLLLKKNSVDGGFAFSLNDESDTPLEGERLFVAYQIIQEAVANIRKHSGAKHVEVTFRNSQGGLQITVEDDGCGFDPTTTDTSEHFGLTDMRERAHALGGTFEIVPSRKGTSVKVWIPEHDRSVTGVGAE
jgi:signal transduction histidine kinase